jgi:ADP-heptose:LPS heptosyltransferase
LNAVFAEDEGLVLAPPSVAHLLGDVAESEPCRVGIVPLTPWAGKRWTPAHWREVIETLRQRGSRPVVLCGPGERGEAAQAVDRAQAPIEEMRHTADWAAALETCGGVITVNTGAMHIAASLDRPMVVIEASGRLPLWAPDSARARVLHRQDVAECAPCHQTGGNLEHARRCMDMITPDEVLEAR